MGVVNLTVLEIKCLNWCDRFRFCHFKELIESNKKNYEKSIEDFQIQIEQLQLNLNKFNSSILDTNANLEDQNEYLKNLENAENTKNMEIKQLQVSLFCFILTCSKNYVFFLILKGFIRIL